MRRSPPLNAALLADPANLELQVFVVAILEQQMDVLQRGLEIAAQV